MNTTMWHKRWAEGSTGWDLGQEHAKLHHLVQLAQETCRLEAGSRIWVPGCGRAHEARALANQGFDVVAVDVVEQAIAEAKALQNPASLKLLVADALTVEDSERGAYGAICDRAMLCALDIEDREKYKKACFNRLKPGGVWMGILFSKVHKETPPPHAIEIADLVLSWQDCFTLAIADLVCEDSPKPAAIAEEYLIVLRKRS